MEKRDLEHATQGLPNLSFSVPLRRQRSIDDNGRPSIQRHERVEETSHLPQPQSTASPGTNQLNLPPRTFSVTMTRNSRVDEDNERSHRDHPASTLWDTIELIPAEGREAPASRRTREVARRANPTKSSKRTNVVLDDFQGYSTPINTFFVVRPPTLQAILRHVEKAENDRHRNVFENHLSRLEALRSDQLAMEQWIRNVFIAARLQSKLLTSELMQLEAAMAAELQAVKRD